MIVILWTLFELLVNLYQGVMVSYFTYNFLATSETRPFWKSSGVAFGIVLAVAITVTNFITVFESFGIALFIAITFIYSLLFLKGTLLRKAFVALFPFAMIAIISSFFINFFATLSNKPLLELLTGVPGFYRFALLLTGQIFIAYFFITTLNTLKKKCDLGKFEWLLIFVIFIISIVIALFLNLIALDNIIDRDRQFIVMSIVGLAVMNITTYYLVMNLSVKNKAVKENELLKIQQAYERQYINNAKLEYETIMKLKHDFKAHYAVLHTLLVDNKVEKALQHIEQNSNTINAINTYIETNNDVVNAIINLKATTAKAFGIQISCASVSDFTGIDDIDLCNLLSNMLENAITACVDNANVHSEKQIHLKISANDLRCVFSIKNTINKSILTNNPNLHTTKKDKKEHGYGVKIIRTIACKYDGQYDFYEEDDFFYCTVTLRKK